MAASRIVEEQQGTYARRPVRHNGYHAGDFGSVLDGGVLRAGASRRGSRATYTSPTLPASHSAAAHPWA